jgi:uncharacterized protein (UPF0371 family)
LNLVRQKGQQPSDLSSQGWIWRKTRSQVALEVFFRAGRYPSDKKVSNRAQGQMVMKGAPASGFQMIQAKVALGTAEGLFDLPAAAAEP